MTAANEIEAGDRFRFGANWATFLSELTPEWIKAAELSLKDGSVLDRTYLEARGFVVVNSKKNRSLGYGEYAARRVARAEPIGGARLSLVAPREGWA